MPGIQSEGVEQIMVILATLQKSAEEDKGGSPGERVTAVKQSVTFD